MTFDFKTGGEMRVPVAERSDVTAGRLGSRCAATDARPTTPVRWIRIPSRADILGLKGRKRLAQGERSDALGTRVTNESSALQGPQQRSPWLRGMNRVGKPRRGGRRVRRDLRSPLRGYEEFCRDIGPGAK